MKIREIVLEEKQLQEAGILANLWRAGSHLFGTSAEAIAKKKLAAQWADEILQHGAIRTRANRVVSTQFARDTAFVDDAKKAAEKIVNQTNRANTIRGARTAIGKGINIASNIGSVGMSALKAYGYWGFVSTYIDSVNELDAQLAAGEITQKQYDADRQMYMSGLIGKFVTAWAGGKIIKSIAGVPGSVLFDRFGPTAFIGTAFRALGSVGQLWFIEKIKEPENVEKIAKVFCNKVVDPYIGGYGIAALDSVKELFGQAKAVDEKGDPSAADKKGQGGSETDPDKKADPTAKSDKDATSTTPDGKPATGGPGQSSTPDYTNRYTPDNLYRDKNNALDFKSADELQKELELIRAKNRAK